MNVDEVVGNTLSETKEPVDAASVAIEVLLSVVSVGALEEVMEVEMSPAVELDTKSLEVDGDIVGETRLEGKPPVDATSSVEELDEAAGGLKEKLFMKFVVVGSTLVSEEVRAGLEDVVLSMDEVGTEVVVSSTDDDGGGEDESMPFAMSDSMNEGLDEADGDSEDDMVGVEEDVIVVLLYCLLTGRGK